MSGAGATAGLAQSEVDAAARAGVRNSQPEGIGRVVALDGLLCWNNLGRNVVFADLEARPHGVFGSTLFPDEDEPSQYDLDVHAIVDLPELGLVGVLNHIGLFRGFRRAEIQEPAGERLVEPAAQWWFAADVERLCGRSRAFGGVDAAIRRWRRPPRVRPLSSVPPSGNVPVTLSATAFGEVTALGVVPSPLGPSIAVGGDGQGDLARLSQRPAGSAQMGDSRGFPRRQRGLPRWRAVGSWPRPRRRRRLRLGAAEGRGLAALDLADGREVVSGPLPDDIAWGTGGAAVAPFGRFLVAAGRTGCLHLVDPRGGRRVVVDRPPRPHLSRHRPYGGRQRPGVLRLQPGRLPALSLCSARPGRGRPVELEVLVGKETAGAGAQLGHVRVESEG